MPNDAPDDRRHGKKAQDEDDKGALSALSGWRTWLLALFLVAAVIFAAIHWGDVKKFADLLAHARPAWLLAAVAAQLLTYGELAVQWLLVIRAGHCSVRFTKLLPLTITKHFADQLVPTAGMSGNVVVVDRLTAIGASRPIAIASVILTILAYYGSYAISALVALLLLWLHSQTNWIIFAAVGVFLAVAAAVPSLVLWLQKKGKYALPKWLRKIGSIRGLFEMIGEAPNDLVRDGRLIAELTLLNTAGVALDAVTLQFCLFALGLDTPFYVAFSALVMASVVKILGPVPMGLGSFEAASIATLGVQGVPFEAAVSATLLFRGFELWLPLVPGMITTRRHLKKH